MADVSKPLRQTILVVDDNEAIMRIIERHLTAAGYSVLTAGDGKEALVTVAARQPDCVLLDLMMPGMTGLEVLRELKQGPATALIPVILVTAKGEDTDVEQGYREGAADYLTKPFSAVQIVDAVRKVLRLAND
jgi:two-component system phosphate regulon response regulator PhoB